MRTTTPSFVVILILACPWSVSSEEPVGKRYKSTLVIPHRVSTYDIATPRERYYRRHVLPTIVGNSVELWTVWDGFQDQVGAWIAPYVEASRISETIQTSFPIGEQKATKELQALADECAEILGLKAPQVFVRNSPFTTAYVTQAGGETLLTLTSSLLKLYEGRPDELRFVVGRELGRIKCGHLEQYRKAYGVFSVLRSINLAVVPDDYQRTLSTLFLGRLMSYSREMEFSADRAGLLCCQDIEVCYQSLLRMLHGLDAESTWIDPAKPDFDPEVYLKQIEYWENKPLVEFLQEINKFTAQQPYVPERIAHLAAWNESAHYRDILTRTAGNDDRSEDRIVTFETLTIWNVADEIGAVNPYVIVYREDERLFQTTSLTGLKSAHWKNLNQTRKFVGHQPLFFEIWSNNTFGDSFVGGFVIYPGDPGPEAKDSIELSTHIEWNWKNRVTTTRQGIAEVELTLSSRKKDTK